MAPRSARAAPSIVLCVAAVGSLSLLSRCLGSTFAQGQLESRRGVLAAIASSTAAAPVLSGAQVAWAKEKKGRSPEDEGKPDPQQWVGSYEDKNHPGCKRRIDLGESKFDEFGYELPTIIISGTDGDPGCTAGGPVTEFTVTGSLRGETRAVIDFSPKGGPSDLIAKYVKKGGSKLVFPDGNKWKKIGD